MSWKVERTAWWIGRERHPRVECPGGAGLHKTNRAGVLNLDARDFGVSRGDGQSQTLEQGKVDVDIQSLGLEPSETVSDSSQSLTDGFQVIQGFFQSEVFQVVAEDPQARRKVANFSYMRNTAFLPQARST